MTSEAATEIRRRLQAEAGGIRLPSILGMLGALLLASGVIAFIAANWQLIPRVGKLTGVLVLVAAATGLAAYFERRNASRAADAAATAAALIFGAGVALVGQMYHLPADWPAGSVTVGIGAFTLALLLRSDGALIIAFACALSWLYGVQDWRGIGANPWYLLLYLPLLALALGRLNRAVHHMAVLAGAVWLGLVAFNGVFSEARIGGNIAYLLFLSVAFTAAGVAAQEGRLPPLVGACLPWGLLGYAVALSLQLMRSLEASASVPGFASLHVVASGVAGLAAIGVMLAAAQDRKIRGRHGCRAAGGDGDVHRVLDGLRPVLRRTHPGGRAGAGLGLGHGRRRICLGDAPDHHGGHGGVRPRPSWCCSTGRSALCSTSLCSSWSAARC